MELKEYLVGKVAKVVARIKDALDSDALGVNDLLALQELEAAGEKRQGVLVPLGKMIEEINANLSKDDEGGELDLDAGMQEDEGADKKDRGEVVNENAGDKAEPETPDWQKPDYSGALTGDQAAWRNKNIKLK